MIDPDLLRADPEPPAGVGTMIVLNQAMACSQGHHVWVPWLHLKVKSVTWCVHCKHMEEYYV